MNAAILEVLGPSALLLAQYLSLNHDWHIDRVEQRSTMRGIIVGRHETPLEFVGVGINDGTRIQRIEIPDDEETSE